MSSFYGGGASSSSSGLSSTVISVTESTSNDYAKVYNILQDGVTVGTINIPKDMVVSSGILETDPAGMDEGTYLVLTLANADSDTIYINVADLIDVYTVASSATQIQLAISSGNIISATIVNGAVGTAELADSAITAVKIADGTITTTKLAASVQKSLENADSAVQSVTTGTTNGTVSVDGVDVPVYGLGSAAYTNSDDYDSAGAADIALSSANTYTDGKVETALETAASDATTKADSALNSAKEYANSLSDISNTSTIYLNVTTTGTDSSGNSQEELTITTVNSALNITVDEEQESLNMNTAS